MYVGNAISRCTPNDVSVASSQLRRRAKSNSTLTRLQLVPVERVSPGERTRKRRPIRLRLITEPRKPRTITRVAGIPYSSSDGRASSPAQVATLPSESFLAISSADSRAGLVAGCAGSRGQQAMLLHAM